jgi:membrane-bound serine protease (ClpP class)
MRARRFFFALCILLGSTGLFLPGALAQDPGRVVDVIEVRGIIDPTMADYLRARIDAAERDGAYAAIIQIDTPGGLDVSMRQILQNMLDADVPLVAWVAPRGARAASAGTFIAYAAHLLYMAESTTIGAASPVNLGGEDIGDTLEDKITNDAAELLVGIAEQRGRDTEFAADAVREARSIGPAEAVEIGAIDAVASSPADVLRAMDGQTVALGNGEDVTLDTVDDAGGALVTLRYQQMNVFQRLLHTVANPEIAFLLLLIGQLGIIFELYNPGIGLAGILGAVCLLLGFYALSVLPTNWAGVLLILLGVIFFVVDLQTAGLGVWTIGGIASLVAGAVILFAGAAPVLAVDPFVIGVAVVLTLVFFIGVMTAALRVRLRRPITGEEAIIGMVGEAKTDIAPEGTVMTKGTLWRARTMETGIAAGDKVKVMASEGLVLLVEPLHEHDVGDEGAPSGQQGTAVP